MMRGKGNQTARKPRRQEGTLAISHPPPVQNYAVTHGTRLRFIANAAFLGGITYQNLLDLMLTAVSAVSGYDQFFAVKIRSVEAWATAVVGNATSVSVAFVGSVVGQMGDQKWHTDTSMGIQPAHLRARPSAKAQASQFQTSSANTAFILNVPSGAVVDVELTFQQSATANAVAAQNALVGASVGQPYWRGLDGLASATTKLTPVVDPSSII
jgi:hypothetical protein